MGKDLFLSKTTWGAILLLLSPALKAAGIDIGDQQALVDALTQISGLVVVVWGQLTRKAPITSVAGIPTQSTEEKPK